MNNKFSNVLRFFSFFLIFTFIASTSAVGMGLNQLADWYLDGRKKHYLCSVPGVLSLPYTNDTVLCNRLNSADRDKARKFYRQTLSELGGGPPKGNDNDFVTHSVIKFDADMNLRSLDDKVGMYLPFSHQDDGPPFWIAAITFGEHDFSTAQNYYDYLTKLDLICAYIEDAIVTLKEGKSKGITLQRIIVTKIIGALKNLVGANSVLYSPLNMLGRSSVSSGEKEKISKQYKTAMQDKVIPTYKKLLSFMEKEYSGSAASDTGLSQYKGGREYYNFLVRVMTGTNYTPDQIHKMGLEEVEKIVKSYKVIQDKLGFRGNLQEFLAYMISHPTIKPITSIQGAIDYLYGIKKKVDEKMPTQFSNFPKTQLVIKPVEKERIDTAGTYYQPGLLGKRPGVFYALLRNPSDIYTIMATTFLHEGSPGHYYQGELIAENPSLPKLRRVYWNDAMGEGWGLYSESFGTDFGLYDDPSEEVAYLNAEMLRSIRLVVDTGLHAKGWTRSAAINYFKKYYMPNEEEIVSEVDRYIGSPAQALSYKMGLFAILEVKKGCEQSLGKKFDIKKFHDKILSLGLPPPSVMKEVMNKWCGG